MSYPITLQLRGRRVVVVGGGPVAHRRVCRLLASGALVTVIAPHLHPELAAAEHDRLTWQPRRYRGGPTGDLASGPAPAERIWLVHTATGDPQTDAAVAADADALGIWCVRADDGARSAAWSPAVAEGDAGTSAEGLQVAVTGDRDPRRARAVRDAIQAALHSATLPVRRVRAGTRTPGSGAGRVHLVGSGPGDPDLITVRGRALLAAADVVVTDRLVPPALLAGLGPDVEVVDVGKSPGRHPVTQQEINELLVEHARAGRTVVRLKGGDPFVLGRGGEEALHCREHGIPVDVVPGVTSAVSVPAAAGIPVTHRGVATSFVMSSGHDGADVVAATAAAGPEATLVLLMGVATLGATAARLLAAGRAADTPVALIEAGWTPQQRTIVTTLEQAADRARADRVASPAVVVVGAVVGLREQLGDLGRRAAPVPRGRPQPQVPSADSAQLDGVPALTAPRVTLPE